MEAVLVIYKAVGGWRGCIGIVGILALSVMLAIRSGEARHWKKQFGVEQQAFATEHAAFTQTVANYRAAAAAAREADRANAARVVAQQVSINKERSDALTSRLADADSRYGQLLASARRAASSGRPAADVPTAYASGSPSAAAAGQDGLPHADALIATRQAIQLDELIKWVNQTLGIDRAGENAPLAAPVEAHGGQEGRDLRN
jgi:hypothetical protein